MRCDKFKSQMAKLKVQIKHINLQKIREGWLYRKFSSLKTSCIFLGILILFYILGTIFPQGEKLDNYINAGGGFVSFVIFFDLLSIFNTPGFLITALLLFVNLSICTLERFLILYKKKTAIPEALPSIPSYIIPLEINPQLKDADEGIREILKKRLKFKEQQAGQGKTYPGRVFEKGLSYRWLTWIYHLSILFCFFGFFLTYLFAFEDEITLYPGEITTIRPSKAGRWGRTVQGFDFKLVLDEFITEYNQFPKLDYPDDKLSRLAIALGWRGPEYILKDESYFPKDWKSRLRVIKGKQTVLEKTIEVNDPLHYEGITFYQAAYKQNLKIQVDNNPILLEAESENELIAPGIDGKLRFGTLKTGTLFKRDGTMEKIKPFIEVTLIKNGKKEKLGKLELDGTLFLENKRISLREFKEASILSYRYDPGVPILWWSGITALMAMALRVFGAWYRISYRIEERDGAPHLLLNIKTKGLMADEERLLKKLNYSLKKMTGSIITPN